jgi:hypothetical protein
MCTAPDPDDPRLRGCYAQALLKVKIDDTPHNDHYVLVPIQTPGVWGLEPGQDESIARGELDILFRMLVSLATLPLVTCKQIIRDFDLTRPWVTP